ncbi:signal peptidase I [Chitinispirillales bacterium ANBcel5]|uniref:signal peptidase I n=1 Tax=Cellulosispirillum alkaliphilum TaxID=3039283 RepID=UPI002A516E25|nr:signal peptidase I [Chitinispirillales bacterium ANBcel5]
MSKDQARRSEKAGILRLFREMGSALAMALIAIIYVIQAFKIPTGSMEDSLLVGDMLLGLKFIYGAPIVPFSQDLGITTRFPAFADPKPGDVVIFKYPGTERKDYIKRNIAGPGSTVEIRNQLVLVDDIPIELPPDGKYITGNTLDPRISFFAPLEIPAEGDVLIPQLMPVREFLFFKHLVRQENPRRDVSIDFSLYLDGEFSNDARFPAFNTTITLNDLLSGRVTVFNRLKNKQVPFDFNTIDDWVELDNVLKHVESGVQKRYPDAEIELRKHVYIDGQEIEEYQVRFDNYFMIGDNRNNSMDSRYWGYVNRNYIKAKAFILYMSLDSGFPWIRWDRLGRLIRSYNLTAQESFATETTDNELAHALEHGHVPEDDN